MKGMEEIETIEFWKNLPQEETYTEEDTDNCPTDEEGEE